MVAAFQRLDASKTLQALAEAGARSRSAYESVRPTRSARWLLGCTIRSRTSGSRPSDPTTYSGAAP